ncbi:MAG: MBOAT family O-acyltransferase [Leptospirales bacterium]
MLETILEIADFLGDNLIIFFIIIVISIIIFLEWSFKNENIHKKKSLIIIISGGLLIWLDVGSFFQLLLLSTIVYILIYKKIQIKKKLSLFVLCSIGLLLLIKDYQYFLNIENPYIPLGVSYYYFRLLSMMIDYANRPKEFENINPIDYYSYVFFFPIILAGPIQRFRDFKYLETQFSGKPRRNIYLLLFTAISVKFLLIDNYLYQYTYEKTLPLLMQNMDSGKDHLFFLKLSLFGFSAFIHAYFDLMLYTEISKSFSKLLGFTHQENFNKPLLASNLSMFWQRWHMSLSNWTRDYVFFPALIKTKKAWISTYLSMLTIGIWHALTLNWITWAILHATGINFYGKIREMRWFKRMKNNKAGALFLRITGNIITIYFVSFVFVMVAVHDFQVVVKLYSYAFAILFN